MIHRNPDFDELGRSVVEPDAWLQAAAHRMARQCRHVVQGCLREEEWLDADAEFCAIIFSGLMLYTQTKQD